MSYPEPIQSVIRELEKHPLVCVGVTQWGSSYNLRATRIVRPPTPTRRGIGVMGTFSSVPFGLRTKWDLRIAPYFLKWRGELADPHSGMWWHFTKSPTSSYTATLEDINDVMLVYGETLLFFKSLNIELRHCLDAMTGLVEALAKRTEEAFK